MAAVAIVIFVLGVSMIMCALCAAAGDEDIREESKNGKKGVKSGYATDGASAHDS